MKMKRCFTHSHFLPGSKMYGSQIPSKIALVLASMLKSHFSWNRSCFLKNIHQSSFLMVIWYFFITLYNLRTLCGNMIIFTKANFFSSLCQLFPNFIWFIWVKPFYFYVFGITLSKATGVLDINI